jgi:hypothetical protein
VAAVVINLFNKMLGQHFVSLQQFFDILCSGKRKISPYPGPTGFDSIGQDK